MPVPAAPAPARTTRASASDWSQERRAVRIVAQAIAAVPWMSSLKLQTQFR